MGMIDRLPRADYAPARHTAAPLWRRFLDLMLAADARYRQRRGVESLDGHLRRDLGLRPEWDAPQVMRHRR